MSLAISQSIASDGQTTAQARVPFAQGVSVTSGLVSNPGLSFIGSATTGWYSPAANQMAATAGGVQALLLTSTGVTFPLAVTFSGNQSVTGSFTVSGPTTLNGNTTIGDAGTDTLTVNATGTFSGNQTFNGTVTVPNASFSNAKLANVATQTIKGRTTAGSGAPEDLTATQATAILNPFVGDSGSGGTKGLAPAPASGDATARKILEADGTWKFPTIRSIGRFVGSTGATVVTRGVTLSNTGTGLYTATLSPAMADTNYIIQVTPEDGTLAGVAAIITSKTISSFNIEQRTAAAAYNPAFLSIIVSVV